jgi:hypothetical protein
VARRESRGPLDTGQPHAPSSQQRPVVTLSDGTDLTPQQHTAAHHHPLTEPRHENRSSPHRRPEPATAARHLHYLLPPAPLQLPPRVARPFIPPSSSTTDPMCLPRTRCRRPASSPSSVPPGPARLGLPGRSRKGGPAQGTGTQTSVRWTPVGARRHASRMPQFQGVPGRADRDLACERRDVSGHQWRGTDG